jgi:hypothetical protein
MSREILCTRHSLKVAYHKLTTPLIKVQIRHVLHTSLLSSLKHGYLVWERESGKLPNNERRQFLTILIVLYFMDRAERRPFVTILIVLYFMARIVSVCPVPGARLLRVCHRLLHVRDLPGALPLCL